MIVFGLWYACSLSKSTRSKTSFWQREGRMLGLWRSREARTLSSSRSGALGTSTLFASSTKRRLISLSSLFLQVRSLFSLSLTLVKYLLTINWNLLDYLTYLLDFAMVSLCAKSLSICVLASCKEACVLSMWYMFCRFENVGVYLLELPYFFQVWVFKTFEVRALC